MAKSWKKINLFTHKSSYTQALCFAIASLLCVFGKQVSAFEKSVSIDPEIQAIVNSISQAEVENKLRMLVKFGTRSSTSQACQKACEWARDSLQSWGLDSIYLDKYNSSHAPNVVGIKKGTKSIQDSLYILCSHIDAASSGADDNGSGTICVMLAAKAMSKYSFRNDVRFILFSGEETGILGSAAYVNAHKSEKIRGVIDNDMIYWFQTGDTDLDIELQVGNKWLGDFLVAASKNYVNFPAKVNYPPECESDFVPFQKVSIPAIRTLSIVGGCGLTPHYHKASDTVGQSGGNFPLMTKVIKADVAAMALLAVPLKTSLSPIVYSTGDNTMRLVRNVNTMTVILSGTPTTSSNLVAAYHVNGKCMTAVNVSGDWITKGYAINMLAWPAGIYQVRVQSGSKVFVHKIVVSK